MSIHVVGHYLLLTVDVLWSIYVYPVAKLWSQYYVSIMQIF